MFTFTGFDLTLGSAREFVAEAFVAGTVILMSYLMALSVAKIIL